MKRLLFLSTAAASSLFAVAWIEPTKRTKILSASEVIAVDGDTIDHGDDRYRLVGFDAPETFRAQCEAERALGLRTKDRLTELINHAGAIELEIEPDLDLHDRFLAVGRTDGHNVGDVLISEDLARPYSGGKRGSWCG